MIFEKIKELISRQFDYDEDKITMDTSFADDLGADSLDVAELMMSLEEGFEIEEIADEEMKNIALVSDLVDYVTKAIG